MLITAQHTFPDESDITGLHTPDVRMNVIRIVLLHTPSSVLAGKHLLNCFTVQK